MEIRILHIVPKMQNNGGIENMIMNYYRNIDRNKIQFDFLVHSDDETELDNEIKSLGGNIYRVTHYHKNILKNIFETLKLFVSHKEIKTVHIHTSSGIKIIDGLLARMCGKNVIFHSHSIYPRKKLKYVITTPFFRLIGTEFFACSKKAGQYFFGNNIVNKSSFKIINNAIDISKYSFSKSVRDLVRKEFKISDKFVIGHVGRFTSEKNHIFLLKIFNEVIKVNSNAVLMLIGDGPLLETIKKTAYDLGISKNIVFTGVRSDVNKLLQAIDLFVFPSLYEGLGMALVEAQASGLYCIAANTILEEVNITGNVEFLSLNEPKLWINKIITYNQVVYRKNEETALRNAGYDISIESKKLQSFYVELEYKNLGNIR